MACTIAAMHKQVGQRTVARSDPLRLAPANWCTSLLHAYCGNRPGVAAFSVEARALGRLPADPLVVSSRGRGLVALCGGRRCEDRLACAEYAPAEYVQLA